MLVRPVADIASFPAPGWTVAPLFEKVNSTEPDDSTFITGLAVGAEDPQVTLQLGDLGIPDGASGQIRVKMRLRWSAAPSVEPDAVRIGLGTLADLGSDNPTLFLERSIAGFFSTDFVEVEVVFEYSDWTGDSSLFGIYLEMTPNAADAIIPNCSWIEVESCVPALLVDRCSIGDLTPGEIITDARDLHPSFELRAHPNAILLRGLSSFEKTMSGRVARVNPALIAAGITVSLPLTDFAGGITLPQITYFMPGVEIRNRNVVNTVELLNLTLRSDRDSPAQFVYLRGKQLFLSAPSQQWRNWDSINFQVVLTPRPVTKLDQLLLLPSFAKDAYVGALAQLMATRQGLVDVRLIGAEMVSSVFDTIAQQKSAETFGTRDVFPGDR